MRADGRVAIFNCDAFASPFRLTSLGTFPYGAGKKVKLKLTQAINILQGTTLSHRLRRCQLPVREHIKVGNDSDS